MPFVPSGVPAYAQYSTAKTLGTGISYGATAALAGYQVYELATAKGLRESDYLSGALGIAGALPIVGPFANVAAIGLGASFAISDYIGARRKRDRMKRALRHGEHFYGETVRRGTPEGLAAYETTRQIGSKLHLFEQATVRQQLAASPYAPPLPSGPFGALKSLLLEKRDPRQYRDPQTGRLLTFEELKRKESGQFAAEASWELFTRVAPGRGLVPGPFARYHGG